VGESNPYSANSVFALYPTPGSAGARMAKLLDLWPWQYLNAFDSGQPMRARQVERAARVARAGTGLGAYQETKVIVMLGARVSQAFGLGDMLPFEKRRCRRSSGLYVTFIRVPHPSGLNRAWNDPANVRRLRAVLNSYVRW
jgi:hypothetical protein